MKYLLFMMFFIAPPSDAPPDKKVWALQNTVSLQFDTKPACVDAIENKIIPSVKSTDTVSVFGWCFPSDDSKAVAADTGPSFFQWPPAPTKKPSRQR